MLKTEEQIVGIRKSCNLSASALEHIAKFIEPGITTLKINELLEEFIRYHGGIPAALNYSSKGSSKYPAATCISVNEAVCHGIPDDTILKDGDIVGIDVATILNGYFGDTCYTFPVGSVCEKTMKFLNISKNAMYIGINQIKDGSPIGNIGYEINRYISRNGYQICTSFTGHGVGLAFHESPAVYHVAHKNSGILLQEGMTITVEPIVNFGTEDIILDGWKATTADKKLSAQYEHTVLVKKNGFEILTLSPLWDKLL